MRQSLLPVFIAMLFAAGLLASTNSTANAYKFGGMEMETRYALNFTHHGARLYFPDLGRFASPDPLAGETPQTATYLYCAANPANRINQTGLILDPHNTIIAQTVSASQMEMSRWRKKLKNIHQMPNAL